MDGADDHGHKYSGGEAAVDETPLLEFFDSLRKPGGEERFLFGNFGLPFQVSPQGDALVGRILPPKIKGSRQVSSPSLCLRIPASLIFT
jgi:hypothetical protein